MRPLLRVLLIAIAALLSFAALAQSPGGAPIESSIEFGNESSSYELHYSLVPTTFLSDSVAGLSPSYRSTIVMPRPFSSSTRRRYDRASASAG